MASDDENREDEVLETGEGYAGEAHESTAELQEALSDEAPMSEAELDELQEKFGEKRRRGGPDLHAETLAREDAQEEAPDVEPTETMAAEEAVEGW